MTAATRTGPAVSDDSVRRPSRKILNEIVRRVVAVADPEQIILFGSAARGEMGPDSDLDLLIVKANVNRLEMMQMVRRGLRGVGHAIDIIVVTPEDVERYRHSWCLVIEPALREGKLIYAKGAIPVA